MKKLLAALLVCLLMVLAAPAGLCDVVTVNAYDYPVEEDGWYDTLEEVAVYLDTYDDLPDNYLTKKEAQNLGWVSKQGNLWDVAYGCSIGGDRFGNYEGLLPDAKGRKWTECDIGFDGSYRGGERIVFSNDGLIYYTNDHYASFNEIEVVRAAADEAHGNVSSDYSSYESEEDAYGAGELVLDLIDLWLSL